MKFRIDLKILFFLALFAITKQIHIYIIVMLCAILHELAHFIVGRILGFYPNYIEIMPFGCLISLRPKIEDYRRKIKKACLVDMKYILVAIAGPLFNLVLANAFIINENMLKSNDYIFTLKQTLIYSNFLIFLINLIPIYPLDGGRILKSILRLYFEKRIVDKIINYVANISIIILTFIGSVTILYFKNIAILLILMYFWELVIYENKRFELKKGILKI